MSGLLTEISVLEETGTRVANLTDEATKRSTYITNVIKQARQHLAPLSQRGHNLEIYRQGAKSVLDVLSEVQSEINALRSLKVIIEQGIDTTGLENYVNAIAEVRAVGKRLAAPPLNNQFQKISKLCEVLKSQGLVQLEEWYIDAINTAYPPIDGLRYLDSSEPMPNIDPARLGAVRLGIQAFDVLHRPDAADTIFGKALSAATKTALASAAAKTSQRTGALNVKAFSLLADDVKRILTDSLPLLFREDSRLRLQKFTEVVQSECQVQISKVTVEISQRAASSSNQWAMLEAIDSARGASGFDQKDLAKYKADALKQLTDLFVEVQRRARQTSPSESGVAGATVQTLTHLRTLSQPSPRAGADVVLSEIPMRGYLPNPLPAWANRNPPSAMARAYPLALYFADCIECLHDILSQVSVENFKDVSQRGVFMLFNLTAIEQSQNKGTIGQVMGQIGKEQLTRLNKLALRDALKDWAALGQMLMEVQVVSQSKPSKLSSKERDALKETCRQFNQEFEVLMERQKRYNITDPELRRRLVSEIRKLIVPVYIKFYDKHSTGDFTKNVDKYIKWNKDQFDDMLSSMA